MTASGLRQPWAMTDAELIAEAQQLQEQQAQDALIGPAHLLRYVRPMTYKIRPHIRVISNSISAVHEQCVAGRSMAGPRLLIEEPPQTGKTVTGVVGAAFWWLCLHPTTRIIVGSHGQGLAVDRGVDIKRLVEEHGSKYGLYLERGSTSKQDWRLTSGGGVRSVGVGSGIAGIPADVAFVDDPLKSRAEASSAVARDRVWNWFSADITSRLAPGAPIILIMTPWHPDDIAARLVSEQGRVEDGGRWQVVRMPALCDDPDRDPLGRRFGDPLPHPKIRTSNRDALLEHWMERRRTSTVQDWASLYMCDPKPEEGALLQRALLRERRCYQSGSPCHPCDGQVLKSAVAVDPSGGGRDTAGIVAGYLGSDKRLYITHDESGVMPSDEWAMRACELAVRVDADRIIVEKNFGGDMAKLAVRTAWSAMVQRVVARHAERRREILADRSLTGQQRRDALAAADAELKPYQRLCPRIELVLARKAKRLRAEPIAQQWIEDRIRTAAYLPDLEEEWATWQVDQKDSPGRIDASCYLAYGLLPVPGASTGTGSVRRPPSGSMPTSTPSPLAGLGGGVSGFGPLG